MFNFKTGIEWFPETGDFQGKTREVLGKVRRVGCPTLNKDQRKKGSLNAPEWGKAVSPVEIEFLFTCWWEV